MAFSFLEYPFFFRFGDIHVFVLFKYAAIIIIIIIIIIILLHRHFILLS